MKINQESPEIILSTKTREITKFKIKKRNTMGDQYDEYQQEENNHDLGERIKSLGNLKFKIHKLKE